MATMYQKTQLDLVERLEQKAVQIADLRRELRLAVDHIRELEQQQREREDDVKALRCNLAVLLVEKKELEQERDEWIKLYNDAISGEPLRAETLA